MSRTTIAGVVAILALAVALVLGTQYLGVTESNTVTTVIGLIGVVAVQIMNGNKTDKTEAKVTELNADLRNGTFEKLLREAVMKIAADDSTQLNITQEGSENDGRRQDL